MPRDVLGLDPYQRNAISCARVGCVFALLGLMSAVGMYIYEALQPGDGSFQLAAGVVAIASVISLILARARLSKEALAWSDVC